MSERNSELLVSSGALTREVRSGLGEILPSSDPLDSDTFDPIVFINSNFPSEAAIDRLDPLTVRVSNEITDLDDEISLAVQRQSLLGVRGNEDVGEAKEAIHALFDKIRDMKGKAVQSEAMVQEICRDIKQLDYAKRHLQVTITSLKRLQMLITAVDQLKRATSDRQYREAANLLDAVRQLLGHFEGYQAIPKIADLNRTVVGVKESITSQIYDAFNEVGELADKVADPTMDIGGGDYGDGGVAGSAGGGNNGTGFTSLTEACAVVDALGADARRRQINSFSAMQLRPYVSIFGKGGENSGLEHIDRRFAWFRRLLRSLAAKFEGVFPAHWQLQRRLCVTFLERTREHVLAELGSGDTESMDVQVLLRSLQSSIKFEKDMKAVFELEAAASGVGGGGSGGGGGGGNDEVDLDEDGNMIDPNSAKGVKLKYERKRAQEALEEQHRSAEAAAAAAQDSSTAATAGVGGGGGDDIAPIQGILSGVFDPFMTPYIALERKQMDDMLVKVMEQEAVDRDGALPVFSSSVNMFVYIKGSVKRCTALTSGQTFFSLQREFQGCLRTYAGRLRAKLPLGSNGSPDLGENKEVDVCYVVNTAEYCAETVPQLEEMVRSRIDAAYADSIDLAGEQDEFHDIITAAVRTLVGGLEHRLDPALVSMSRMNWGTLEDVGEESEYVLLMNSVIEPFVPGVRDRLSSLYFRNFCAKFATSFLPKFLNLILRQKRINEMASQQLLLDTYNLKTLMLQLPNLGFEGEAPPVPMSYTKFVTKQMTKIEMVLKLVGTDASMLVERFKIMWPDGEAKDLQAIMQVKGLRRQEQQMLLETLGLGSVQAADRQQGVESMRKAVSTAAESAQSASQRLDEAGREMGKKMEHQMRSVAQDMTSGFRRAGFGFLRSHK